MRSGQRQHQVNRPQQKEMHPPREATAPISPSDRDRRRSIIVVLLTFLGGTTLFAAWISQNYFKDIWTSERQFLEKTQFLVEIGQLKAEMWQVQMNLESQRSPMNPDLYSSAMFNFVRSLATVNAWEASRISTYGEEAINEKNRTLDRAQQALDKHDQAALIQIKDSLIKERHEYEPALDQVFLQEMYGAKTTADFWNNVFLLAYIAGSSLIGVGWVLTRVFGWPSQILPLRARPQKT
jgi:hypothetical protein